MYTHETHTVCILFILAFSLVSVWFPFYAPASLCMCVYACLYVHTHSLFRTHAHVCIEHIHTLPRKRCRFLLCEKWKSFNWTWQRSNGLSVLWKFIPSMWTLIQADWNFKAIAENVHYRTVLHINRQFAWEQQQKLCAWCFHLCVSRPTLIESNFRFSAPNGYWLDLFLLPSLIFNSTFVLTVFIWIEISQPPIKHHRKARWTREALRFRSVEHLCECECECACTCVRKNECWVQTLLSSYCRMEFFSCLCSYGTVIWAFSA